MSNRIDFTIQFSLSTDQDRESFVREARSHAEKEARRQWKAHVTKADAKRRGTVGRMADVRHLVFSLLDEGVELLKELHKSGNEGIHIDRPTPTERHVWYYELVKYMLVERHGWQFDGEHFTRHDSGGKDPAMHHTTVRRAAKLYHLYQKAVSKLTVGDIKYIKKNDQAMLKHLREWQAAITQLRQTLGDATAVYEKKRRRRKKSKILTVAEIFKAIGHEPGLEDQKSE